MQPIRWITRLVAFAACMFLIARPANATDRYYRDIHERSPNGRYKLDAVSPDNHIDDGRVHPFAKDFTYTLTDTANSKVLWQHRQMESECSPVAAWVHDGGVVVVRSGWDELRVFDPATGVSTKPLDILEQFPENERRVFVHETTAGPMWSGSSVWYFLEHDNRLYFSVRTHWGRRVILDTTTGLAVKDTNSLHDGAVSREREWTTSTLRQALPKLKIEGAMAEDEDWSMWSGVITAADTAADLHHADAIPLLREFEKCSLVGTSIISSAWIFEAPPPPGSVDPGAPGYYDVRSHAQKALRRLGAKPSSLPATRFREFSQDGLGPVFQPTPAEPRAEAIKNLKPGMTPREVLTLLGAPDRLSEGVRGAWEYHIDSDTPSTLQVCWSDKTPFVVLESRIVTPPTWQCEETEPEP